MQRQVYLTKLPKMEIKILQQSVNKRKLNLASLGKSIHMKHILRRLPFTVHKLPLQFVYLSKETVNPILIIRANFFHLNKVEA